MGFGGILVAAMSVVVAAAVAAVWRHGPTCCAVTEAFARDDDHVVAVVAVGTVDAPYRLLRLVEHHALSCQ